MKDNAGVTLIELIVVISIIGLLVAGLGFSFQDWKAGYKAEGQVKELYMDLMNARARAMHRNRVHFVRFLTNSYSIYEDTNPGPDGDDTLQTSSDTRIAQKNTDYSIEPHLSYGQTTFKFGKGGLASFKGKVRLVSGASPDFDCIVLFSTRINLGKWDDMGTSDTSDDVCEVL